MRIERIADRLGFAEGPAFLADGTLIFTEIWRSRIARWTPEAGVEEHVFVGGGPNSVCPGADGSLFVTQNGGRDRTWRAREQRRPAIVRVSPSGEVEALVTEIDSVKLSAPNDLAFGPDGRLYFTDPVGDYHPEIPPPPGYLFAIAPDGSSSVLHETGPTYPNGIAVEADGNVVWVESFTRKVMRLNVRTGEVELLHTLEEPCVPDGLAVAANGDLYIATLLSRGVDIVAPDGGHKGQIMTGGRPSNCAFRGSTLIVTDGGSGTGNDPETGWSGGLYRVELDAVTGLETFSGTIS